MDPVGWWSTEDKLRALVPPVPPEELRKITVAPETEVFLWTGLVDVLRCLELYERHRGPVAPERTVLLDLGCGCGRLCRFLNDLERWEAHASDVNPDLVHWCQETLPGVRTVLNEPAPPLPYLQEQFDLIYSLSIFTHLPETRANAWLTELHRVLAPGGLLILSTSGSKAVEIIKGSKTHQEMMMIDYSSALEIERTLADRGIVFLQYSPDVLNVARAGSDYGNTFIHPSYVHTFWNNQNFEIVEHIAGGVRGWQDLVVLRRRL